MTQSAEIVAMLSCSTLSKGMATLRDAGLRLPGDLARDVRSVDAAAALLRHPGAAKEVVDRLACSSSHQSVTGYMIK